LKNYAREVAADKAAQVIRPFPAEWKRGCREAEDSGLVDKAARVIRLFQLTLMMQMHRGTDC
jgi:hypothetical protein